HTRSDRDWSSDVCSSDLTDSKLGEIAAENEVNFCTRLEKKSKRKLALFVALDADAISVFTEVPPQHRAVPKAWAVCARSARKRQIGRASCRERGERAGVS